MTEPLGSRVRAANFDFLLGAWRVRNRRIDDLLSDEGRPWDEFESIVTARSILGGGGVLDRYEFPDFPGRGRFYGVCVRLVHPPTDRWKVWWASSTSGGLLDPPVVGGFVDGKGIFHGDDSYGSHPVKVRTCYSSITPVFFRWEQTFSFDGGRSFQADWIMEFERVG